MKPQEGDSNAEMCSSCYWSTMELTSAIRILFFSILVEWTALFTSQVANLKHTRNADSTVISFLFFFLLNAPQLMQVI